MIRDVQIILSVLVLVLCVVSLSQKQRLEKEIEQTKQENQTLVNLESNREAKFMQIIRASGRNAWHQGYSAALAKRIDPAFDLKKQRAIDSLELERIFKGRVRAKASQLKQPTQ